MELRKIDLPIPLCPRTKSHRKVYPCWKVSDKSVFFTTKARSLKDSKKKLRGFVVRVLESFLDLIQEEGNGYEAKNAVYENFFRYTSPKWLRKTLPSRWMRLESVRCIMSIMTTVYVADAKSEECAALRLLLLDLKMDVVGEASDWFTTLIHVTKNRVDMLLVDWDLLPINAPNTALDELRRVRPTMLLIILINHLDARRQAALSIGADVFISKGESPERVAEHLRNAAEGILAAAPIG